MKPFETIQYQLAILIMSTGETIPIRLFLGGFDLTPTFRDVNKKFSTRYYLSLVLIDEGTLHLNPLLGINVLSLSTGSCGCHFASHEPLHGHQKAKTPCVYGVASAIEQQLSGLASATLGTSRCESPACSLPGTNPSIMLPRDYVLTKSMSYRCATIL